MTLKEIRKHIISSGFWRLMSLVLKRGLSIAKVVLQKLPPTLNPILYVLHFLRAFLRVVNFFRKTKNKNLGETRKLFFSLFKVVIALTALAFLCCGFSIPAVLLSAFFAYSVIKLIDSSGVFIFSLFAFLKTNKNSVENQWMREQYRDNLVKHASILAIGVSITVVTAVFIAGIGVLAWTSPFLLALLASISVFTAASGIYFLVLNYKHRRLGDATTREKLEYHAKRKLFAAFVVFGLVSVALVTIAPLFTLSALGVAIMLLNSLDAIKSIYDYFCDTKVFDSKPGNLEAQNSLIDAARKDYYACKDRILYLKTLETGPGIEKSEEIIQANKIFVAKEGLVKLLALQHKLLILSEKEQGFFSYLFAEKAKIATKKDCLTHELAGVLKDGKTDPHGEKEKLIHLLIEAIISLNKDYEKLLKTLEREDKDQRFTRKTQANMENISVLEKNLWELLEYDAPKLPSNETVAGNTNLESSATTTPTSNQRVVDSNTNNVLLDLFNVHEKEDLPEEKTKPKQFYQSFWKKRGDCEDLSLFFKAAKQIEEEGIKSQNSFRQSRSA
jgi:hypothetical protein